MKTWKQLLNLVLFALSCHTAFAQKETNNWFFGDKASLDFNATPPATRLNGALQTVEGCASISDSLGGLLFYTNGITIYDKTHAVMQNGTGLLASETSSQSSIIIKKPGSSSIYYVFTVASIVEQNGVNGLRYSVVDMTLNNGKGAVTSKNNPLLTPVAEKITAVNHRHDRDVWVMVHKWNSNEFYAYPVTDQGIGTPVISRTGAHHTGSIDNALGYMKFSPDGARLAVTLQVLGITELFDFDDSTGVVSNPIRLQADGWTYGLEFSQNCENLYVSTIGPPSVIYKYHLLAGNGHPDSIQRSLRPSGTISRDLGGALQMGSNGRIYAANYGTPLLSTINFPDLYGSGSVYVPGAVNLSRNVRHGLPNFNQSFFFLPHFTATNLCRNDVTAFKLANTGKFVSVEWNFDDPASGAANTSTLFHPKHRFTRGGKFKVSVTVRLRNGWVRTGSAVVEIINPPAINSETEKQICQNDTLWLSIKEPATQMLWSDGSTGSTLAVTKPGLYWLKATNDEGCSTTDSIQISFVEPPQALHTQGPVPLCFGDSVLLRATTPGASYKWQNGSADSVITVKRAGTYYVERTNGSCTFTDSVTVVYRECPNGSGFRVPNIITPNNDGLNDFFAIPGAIPGSWNLEIFNRWGKSVLREEAYQNDWNGSGTAGVYYYILHHPETGRTMKGWLEVVL